jgi:translation initiation factor 5A
MPVKIVEATELRSGSSVLIDGVACTVRGLDVSKTGKHGSSKVRFEAIGVIDGKKRVVTVPGHERFDVPLIEKKRGQVLSMVGEKANIMDSDSFETFDVAVDPEAKDATKEGVQIEYWDIEGDKVIKRVVG